MKKPKKYRSMDDIFEEFYPKDEDDVSFDSMSPQEVGIYLAKKSIEKAMSILNEKDK